MIEEETHEEKDTEEPHETAKEETPHKETHEGADQLKETVNALSERVSTLESTITNMLPQNRDETPVKKPWTHRSFG